MPSSLVEQEHRVGSGRDVPADFGEVKLHCLAIAARHDQGCAFAAVRTDGAEYPGGGPAQVSRCNWPRPAPGPATGDLCFLPDPGLILPPQFYCGVVWQALPDLRQTDGEVFLKSAISCRRCP